MVRTERDSRALILAAAASEFTSHGVAGARVERIARRAGVNKQLLFYYFGSKAGLHAAVVASLLERVRTTVGTAPGSGPADARVRAAIGGLFKVMESEPHLVRLSTQQADAGPDSPFRAALHVTARPLRQVVLEGQGIGHFRDDADPDFVADMVVSAVVGHLASSRRAEGLVHSTDWSEALADLIVRGLAW